MTRLREIAAMPPEPIEILVGVGGIIWSAAWLRFLMNPGMPVGPAYQDLAQLPPAVQALIVLASAIGGVVSIALAWSNAAPLRFVSVCGMGLFWLLLLLHVWIRVGFSPTAACYLMLFMFCWTAALMLLISGWVRFLP